MPALAACLCANLNGFAADYAARFKVGGMHLDFHQARQLSVIAPDGYTDERVDFISQRVLELTYTAWDIKAFAQDMGCDGPPFVWDEERRAQLRAQLDALYFHLYGIARDDVDYIMETFPIVKRKDIEQYGEYRTKQLILAYYDDYATGNMATWHGPSELKEPKIHLSP